MSSAPTSHRTARRRTGRPGGRLGRTTALLIAALLAVAGCSAGQETQTADHEAAINGTDAQIGDIDLENVYLHAELADSPDAVYGEVRLAFTAVNTSPIDSDRLVEIGSPIAESVTLEASGADLELGPGSRLAAGQPVHNVDPTSAPDHRITVPVTLSDTEVSPGLTYPFEFRFEKAGTVGLEVPFDVWNPGESQPTHRPLPPSVTP